MSFRSLPVKLEAIAFFIEIFKIALASPLFRSEASVVASTYIEQKL
jgi:hypothetical protein